MWVMAVLIPILRKRIALKRRFLTVIVNSESGFNFSEGDCKSTRYRRGYLEVTGPKIT